MKELERRPVKPSPRRKDLSDYQLELLDYEKDMQHWRKTQLERYDEIDQVIILLADGCPIKRRQLDAAPILYLAEIMLFH